MIQRVRDLLTELRDVYPGPHARWHPRQQQETPWGIVRAFLGEPCEFGEDCAYKGLGWRCGHLRASSRPPAAPRCPHCGRTL